MFSESCYHLIIQRGINRMFRLHKLLLLAAVMAGAIALALPGSASAAFQIQLTDQGTGATTGPINVFNGDNITNLVVGNFTLSGVITIQTTTPFAAVMAIDNASVTLNNATNPGQQDTLVVKESATGFSAPNAPTGPSYLNSSADGLVSSGTLVGGGFTSYVDTTNTIFGTSGPSVGETFSTTNAIAGFGSLIPVTTGPFILSGTYALTNVGSYTLADGTTLVGTLGDTQVSTPEPASVMAFLSAVPFWALAPGCVAASRSQSPKPNSATVINQAGGS